MNNHKNYTTNLSKRARILLIVLLALIVVAGTIFMAAVSANMAYSEANLVRCWILCKPGTQVNVRRRPTTDSKSETQLDAGDEVLTDGETQNGWVRVYGVGENGGGWVYVGYLSTEEPVKVGARYVCVAKKQAACRRWMNGPQIENNGRKQWLKNGENVDVFLVGDGWAVTSRGYIQSEWLEVDPE